MEVLDGVDVDIGITEQAPVSIAVVGVTIQTGEWVLTVGVAAYRTGIVTVDGAYGQ